MKENQHFYASSCAMWATTNEERDLPALLELMEKDGYTYNLYMVPGPHDAEYEIKMYCPQVEGAEWLGTFTLPKKKARK
jgi:hypothetical protein